MKVSTSVHLLGVALSAASFHGCAAEPVGLQTTALLPEECPDRGCGDNSALIGGILDRSIHELTNPGLLGPGDYNGDRVRIVGMRKNGTPYRLHVQGHQLRALDIVTGGVAHVGTSLIGSVIEIETKEEGDESVYLHILDAHESLTFWVGAPTPPIWSYELGWSTDPNPNPTGPRPENVCPLVPPPDEMGGAPAVEAVFFRGDRYDKETREVIAIGDAAGEWFNIACIGSSIIKLFLNRLTTVSSDFTHQSGRRRRQAALKMFSADYCGTGKSFTIIGKELRWENSAGWRILDETKYGELDPLAAPIDYEAVWTDQGARCLGTPRMADYEEEVEGWLAKINDECEPDLEPCSSKPWFPSEWAEGGSIVTANPPYVP